MDPDVSINKVDCILADFVDALIIFELSLLGFNAVLDFEKMNIIRTADDQGFVKYQIHLAHGHAIIICDRFIELEVFQIILLNNETLRLPVNSVNFMQFFVIKTSLGIIFLRAIHLFRYYFANYFSLRYTIQEMPMRHSKILEDANVQSIVIKKSYIYEWVWSLSIAHCKSVKTYKIIYINVILIDIHWVSLKFSKDSYLEDAIIIVC